MAQTQLGALASERLVSFGLNQESYRGQAQKGRY